METSHKFFIKDASKMSEIENDSIDLVVTSPPYPMIEMWDDVFSSQDERIKNLISVSPSSAFELMHQQLDSVWKECYRVLKEGGFLCINIGDATRTINGEFKLYNNSSRIVEACEQIGFNSLPVILWRKQTNAPNKFMGSGMLPCGAYVTLEHEWILIFRKGSKRIYKTTQEKQKRMESSYFWEERNCWFSDIWEVKGTKQNLKGKSSRGRSAAFPMEIPYRVINMFSQKGDTVLDPFLGTGTTLQAALLLGRNSIGYEIDNSFSNVINDGIKNIEIDNFNHYIKKRFDAHCSFVDGRLAQGKEIKHFNEYLKTPVMTSQEERMTFNYLKNILMNRDDNSCKVRYEKLSDMNQLPITSGIFAKAI